MGNKSSAVMNLNLKDKEIFEKKFYEAVLADDRLLIQQYLTEGVDPNVNIMFERDTENGYFRDRPIVIALDRMDLKLFSALLEAGANPNTSILGSQRYLIFDAIRRHTPAFVEALVSHPGINLSVRNQANDTPFIVSLKECLRHSQGNAAFSKYLSIAKAILSNRDVDINEPDGHGISPIMLALRSGNLELIELILSSGKVNFSLPENSGVLSASKKYHGLIDLLIRYGLDINMIVSRGERKTVLFGTVEDDNISYAEYLLSRGANPNVRDIDGKTPIYYAVSVAMGKLLMDYGTNIDERDTNGETVLESFKWFIQHEDTDMPEYHELIPFITSYQDELMTLTTKGVYEDY